MVKPPAIWAARKEASWCPNARYSEYITPDGPTGPTEEEDVSHSIPLKKYFEEISVVFWIVAPLNPLYVSLEWFGFQQTGYNGEEPTRGSLNTTLGSLSKRRYIWYWMSAFP